MKKIFISALVALTALFTVSCSKEYLQTSPTSSTGTATIFENADNMALSVNGLYRMMVQQYGGFGQGYNGEGTVKYYIGNFGGNNLNMSGSGNVASMNQSYHDNSNSTFILYPWYYYYRIIMNANSIIDNSENVQGNADQIAFYTAQAKVMRAYCYTMLTQMFHKRWMDGHNDEAKDGNGLVLKIHANNDSEPLASAKDTYAQIYKDLDEAIAVLKNEKIKRNNLTENYEINVDVAYAVYARAALNRQDYENAKKYAQLAYKNYPLMNTAAYNSGFSTPTSEWIWSSYGSSTQPLYYYSFAAYMAYNANTSTIRSYPRCISKHLYDQIPETDIRRDLFLDPKGMKYSQTNGQADSKSYPDLYKAARAQRPLLTTAAFKIAAYMNFKFECETYSYMHLNHFRSSEMYLIEAECDYFLGQEAAARELLNKLTRDSKRDPAYNCTATGAALLSEIKLYRSIELWGEGFEWFDLKRWKDGISRKGFKEGGNWGATYAIDVAPDQYNEWTNVLPLKETNYNELLK